MKVYLVSDGDYSDYHIEGVFNTKAKAKKFMDHFMHDRIETHELDPAVPYCPGDRYQLVYTIAGGAFEITRISNDGSNRGWEPYVMLGEYGARDSLPKICECRYFAKTQEYAHKIATDNITALKAGSTLICGLVMMREFVQVDGISPAKIQRSVYYNCTWRVNGEVPVLVNKVLDKVWT